jgi:uncharacterized protein
MSGPVSDNTGPVLPGPDDRSTNTARKTPAPIERTSSGLLKKFKSARVTFWAPWTEQYDQAGLLLALQRASAPSNPPEKWIKTGLEYYNGVHMLSTVATDRYADWSVSPLGSPTPEKLTVELRREGDEHGKSLWVYRLVLDERGEVKERIPLREICWVLADEDAGGGEEWLLDVSALVARPAKGAKGPLKVDFYEFEVEWSE